MEVIFKFYSKISNWWFLKKKERKPPNIRDYHKIWGIMHNLMEMYLKIYSSLCMGGLKKKSPYVCM
jgi:hypothetical protein